MTVRVHRPDRKPGLHSQGKLGRIGALPIGIGWKVLPDRNCIRAFVKFSMVVSRIVIFFVSQ